MAIGTGMEVGSVFVAIGTKIAGLKKGITDAQKSLGGLKGTVQVGRKAVNDMGKAFGIMGAAVGAALTIAGRESLKFNKDLANLQTMVGNNAERMQEWKGEIQSLSVEMGKSSADLTEGAYQVVSAFGDGADSMDILATSARAATAGAATTTDAINLLSAVTKGYGDVSIEAVDKTADLAFQTVKLGQTTFPELAASIGRAVPLTAALGVSQEELFAVMATGTGVTGKAAEVSTQFRGILQALMAPTEDMSELMESLGYESGKAMIKQNGLMGTMDIIKGVAEATGKPLQKYIGSIEGQTLALALTDAQHDVYLNKLGQMQDSTGAMTDAFEAQTEGINRAGFDIEQMKAKWVVFKQTLGDTVLPIVSQVTAGIMEMLSGAGKWVADNQDRITNFIKIFVKGIGMVVSGWLNMYQIVDQVFVSVYNIVAKAVGWIYDKFRWVLDKLGIELPEINEAFLKMETDGKSAADGIATKWDIFMEGFEKGMEQTTVTHKKEEDKKVVQTEEAQEKQVAVTKTSQEQIDAFLIAQAEKKAAREQDARDEQVKKETTVYNALRRKYSDTLTENELRHAAFMKVQGEDWQTFIEQTLESKLPTGFAKMWGEFEAAFDGTMDHISSSLASSIVEGGGLKGGMDAIKDSLIDTFDTAFKNIQKNVIKGFIDKLIGQITGAFTGEGGLVSQITGAISGATGGAGAGGGAGLGGLGVLGPAGLLIGGIWGGFKLAQALMPQGKSVQKQIEEHVGFYTDAEGNIDVLSAMKAALSDKIINQAGSNRGEGSYTVAKAMWLAINDEGRRALMEEEGYPGRWAKALAAGAGPQTHAGKAFLPKGFKEGGMLPYTGSFFGHGGEGVLSLKGMQSLGGNAVLSALNKGQSIANNIVVNITGNNISSDMDLRNISRKVSDDILSKLQRTGTRLTY